jgi:hypothetical protein
MLSGDALPRRAVLKLIELHSRAEFPDIVQESSLRKPNLQILKYLFSASGDVLIENVWTTPVLIAHRSSHHHIN